jgi:3-phenylpropionate/trans-cinnamate dioxygenase ferredoxin reductase subunit
LSTPKRENFTLTLQNGETLRPTRGLRHRYRGQRCAGRDAGWKRQICTIVDSACATADPAIFAAGDVALTASRRLLRRIESW